MIETTFTLLAIFIVLVPISYLIGEYIANNIVKYCPEKNEGKLGLVSKIEDFIFTICGINKNEKMNGNSYVLNLMIFNFIIGTVCFLGIYFQAHIMAAKYNIDTPSISQIFHTVISYITNTDQTHITPETNLTPLSKWFIIPVLMFTSSATGLSAAVVIMRGIILGFIGSFYVDFFKFLIRILMPLCLITSFLFLIFDTPNTFTTLVEFKTIEGEKHIFQVGPAAAFEAIKLLGQNGGSFFNTNSAHPFSNPNFITNFLQIIAMILMPTVLIYTLGVLLKNNKEANILLIALYGLLVIEILAVSYFELQNVEKFYGLINNAPNILGKETRIGIPSTSIFITAASCVSGATNASIESFHPFSSAIFLFNLIYQGLLGNQGLGFISTLTFIIYTAFMIGLMIGQSPQLYGRKIEKREIILTSIILLINPITTLIGTLIIILTYGDTYTSIFDKAHYFTSVIYEFQSACSNNGSGFDNLADTMPLFNNLLSITMFLGWYLTIILAIYLAESFSKKPIISTESNYVFKTDTVLYALLLLFVSITITIIVFFPFIILGPIIEMIET